METPYINELCKEMPQVSLNVDSEFKTSKRKKVESDESDDDSPNYQVTPHYESISSEDESHTSLIYPPEMQILVPWEVYLAFSLGYLRIEPKLLEMVHVDKKKMVE